MVKRKKSVPVRYGAEKCHRLSWGAFNATDASSDHATSSDVGEQPKTELELILEDCIFYVPIHKSSTLNRDKCVALLGEIQLQFCGDKIVDANMDGYFYANPVPHSSLLYFESVTEDNVKVVNYYKVDYDLPLDAICGLEGKCSNWFHVVYQLDEDVVRLKIYLTKKAIFHLDHPSWFAREIRNASAVRCLISSFCGTELLNYSSCTFENKEYIARIYELVCDVKRAASERYQLTECRCSSNANISSCTCQNNLPNLIPELRNYQCEAVRWMLSMEDDPVLCPNMLHPLYKEIISEDDKVLYYNFIEGFFVAEKPLQSKKSRGGILADEMGLGKTIEVIACILSNKRKLPSSSSRKQQTEKRHNGTSVYDQLSSDPTDAPEESLDGRGKLACVCGSLDWQPKWKRKKLTRVKCVLCKLCQHAECVNFYSEDHSQYMCPHCCILQDLIPSRTTLIISPAMICEQWLEELKQHVLPGTLKVLLYTGVHKMGFIQPLDLADHDIIVCTYETLRKELDYASLPHCNDESGRKLRHPKRFMTVPSPMVAIEFWRICLDEAQMIECTTTRTAEMVMKLSTINHWCVSGTPIQQSIDDLYGLMLFLRVDPVFVKNYWMKMIKKPFCSGDLKPLLHLLKDYMWRSTKQSVIDQIQIPDQMEISHWLQFSPVELHFYQQEHQRCRSLALRQILKYQNLDVLLSTLDKKSVSALLYPLRTLCQACCHPQVVRGQFIPIHKSVITMEEILTSLIKKTTNAAEEAHRNLIATYNGCAGIYIIKQDHENAVQSYRDALQSVEKYKEHLKTDKLQRLHTLHNLAELFDMLGDSVHQFGHTTRDDNLKQEADELRQAYLGKLIAQVKQSRELLDKSQLTFAELNFDVQGQHGWYMEALRVIQKGGAPAEFIHKLKEDSNLQKLNNKYQDVFGLRYVLATSLDGLEDAHSRLSMAVVNLSDEPSCEAVNEAVECHLRPVADSKAPKCVYCLIQKLFINYENKLFAFFDYDKYDEPSNASDALLQTQRRGTWADSETEIILKYILSYCRLRSELSDVTDQGLVHVKYFDALKKEFKALRAVWMRIMDFVSAIDELNMATTRLRLKYPDEPVANPPLKHILEPTDVEQQLITLKSEQVVHLTELRKKLGQLFYLQNLEKTNSNQEENPEPCPICQKQLGEQWAILQCGHCFCTECIRVLIQDFSSVGRNSSMKCAICRSRTYHKEIFYVSARPENKSEHPEISVKGSHSTKVEAIVRCVLKIQLDDPEAKTLIFSTWQDVLSVFSNALEQNQIRYEHLLQGPKYQRALTSFKTDPEIKVLLLPVKSGSKGLNLINATHVILVEPLLNPGNERQAIGRVHRIGQTRPTYVHKFLVKDTIEQNIHSMLQSSTFSRDPDAMKGSEDDVITIQDLKKLFDSDDLL